MWTSNEGEFAAVGTFTPGWVARVEDGLVRSQQDLFAIKKMLRVIAGGARLVMREFARLKEVSEGDAKELRQLSIAQFTRVELNPKEKRRMEPRVGLNAPSDGVWLRSATGKLLSWPPVETTSDHGPPSAVEP